MLLRWNEEDAHGSERTHGQGRSYMYAIELVARSNDKQQQQRVEAGGSGANG